MLHRLLAAATVLLASCAGLADDSRIWQGDIRREDLGSPRREKLTQMELKPAPADLFNTLDSWTGGAALTSDAIKGKVVLVFTFSAWEPTSQKAFEKAAKIADAYASKGLIVVALHAAKQWDEAVSLAKEKNFKGLLAKDDGKLRGKLMVDEDPDFYLIDRAGQLRYADFETDSVGRAVERTIEETAEVAGKQSSMLKDQIAAERREFTKTGESGERAGVKVKAPFKLPDAGVYEKAAWPEKNKSQQNLGANDIQGQHLPNAEDFGQKVIWFTPKPDWDGKVIILDFWATWSDQVKRSTPLLEDVARKYKDDLCVIGVSGQGESDKTVEQFLRKRDQVYAQMFDAKMGESEQRQTLHEKLGIRAVPHAIVISTDGVVRWQGHPLDPAFRRTLELIIEIDPGVKSRRDAEKSAKAPG